MEAKKTRKNKKQYYCEKCNFKCSFGSEYDRHILTAKHLLETNGNTINNKNKQIYLCFCGKKYSSRSGLWKHEKTCSFINNTDEETITKCDYEDHSNDNSTILELISQNKELMNLLVVQNKEHQKVIMELVPRIGNTTNNNNNNSNHFNLHVFLNEDCKEAINFSDFIKQIQVSLTDLENQAENGYIKGITKLFIENLQGLGMNKRPIHCTDKKRKTLYIKENGEWDKEGSQYVLKKGIQEVTRRTFERLVNEQKIHSDEYDDADSEFSTKCISIQRNLTPNHPRESTISKVIDNITQNTGIL